MSFVYFAGCGDLVKIGITRTIYQRIKTLNTSSPTPIVLLAHMVGGEREDQLLLRMGRREGLHVRGEWFHNDKSLKALIDTISGLEPDAARGVADQWWMDNMFGIGREVLPNAHWMKYARAANIAHVPTYGDGQ